MKKYFTLNKKQVCIRNATLDDINEMVILSNHKRLEYEKHQPQFWRYAKDAEIKQSEWFKTLLNNENYIILVGEINRKIMGFIIGNLVSAPEVYNPGGLTLIIDDFCILTSNSWMDLGKILIDTIKKRAISKDAVQIIVVCGAHDTLKKDFLKSEGLNIASEWYVGSI